MELATDRGTPFTAAELMQRHFPPVQWVVPGVIPEGMTLLAAAPKVGKSWLVLGLALALAEGGTVLGALKVEQRPVLYLALEDGPRRLQDRLRSLGAQQGPSSLTFITDLPTGNVPDAITAFLEAHPFGDPVVILDTFGKARPPMPANGNAYQLDYTHAARLKSLVDARPGAGLIVVHHTRKAVVSDFLDAVSGTQGLAGAADTVAVLARDREDGDAVLNVTSRDATEGSYAMRLAPNGAWTLTGGSLEAARATAAQAKVKSGLGDDSIAVLDYVADHPEGVSPAQTADAIGLAADKVRVYLRRLLDAGRVSNPKRGLYTPVITVTPLLSPDGSNNVTEVTPTQSNCVECGFPLPTVAIDEGHTTHAGCAA